VTLDQTYLTTHPWLTFRVDLRAMSFRSWLLLGEAASKLDHVGWALLRPDAAENLQRVYLARGALATTAIEGNTLSEEQARGVVDGTSSLPPSQEYLGREIENILGAFEVIRQEVFDHDGEPYASVPITVEKIKHYNRLVLDGLQVDEDVRPGEIRTHSVVVGNYRGAPAGECELLLTRLCEWLNRDWDASDPARPARPGDRSLRVAIAIVKAVMAHLYLTWIHPFGDGNGRTARLLELQILLSAGFAMPTTQLLSNHYNRTRSQYYRQLAAASETRDPLGFLHYAVAGFVDELRAQLDCIWSMQYVDRWNQFVYETFGEIASDSQRRRLRLVLDLSHASIKPPDGIGTPSRDPIPRGELRHLSPQLAELYAGKTDRMLTRDLDELLSRNLIVRTEAGYVPASHQVYSFMPPARGG
jgi:Fic family protein